MAAAAQMKAAAAKATTEKKEDGPALSEEGITPGHIDMVIEHTGCTRNEAIRVLRETNNDMIDAVVKLTK